MIDKDNPPKKNYVSVNHWERSLDPWHEDAFPNEFKEHFRTGKARESGWLGVDWVGNPILWVADGTEEK